MLNRGGFKIYSVEVENVLLEHPAVIESAIVGKPCPVLGERVHAFVCLKEEGSAGAERSEAFLRRAACRLQGAGELHAHDDSPAAQREREIAEALDARAAERLGEFP